MVVFDADAALRELKGVKTVRFSRLIAIMAAVYGEPRIKGSHHIFSTGSIPPGHVTLQPRSDGMAHPYQIKQVCRALQHFATKEKQS